MNNRQCPSGSVPYTVRQGDTLDQIAKLYNSSLDQILDKNPEIDPERLMVGQIICVPLRIQYYPACPTTNYYVVTEGDTLESISNYFNVTRLQLYYANYGIDPDNLYKDQILCVPVSEPPVRILIDIRNRLLYVRKDNIDIRTFPFTLSTNSMVIPQGTVILLNKQVDPGVQLGARWLGLSLAGLGIRGLNTPQFIESLSTGNSIILSNIDISELFNLVPVGTKVTFI